MRFLSLLLITIANLQAMFVLKYLKTKPIWKVVSEI